MEAMKKASNLNVQADELEIRKAMLGQTLATLNIRKAELTIEQEGFRRPSAGSTSVARKPTTSI